MNKYAIIEKIEYFAPPETQENWDCSGWLAETSKQEIKRIMLCLTVTKDTIKQARENQCDMIISHHPLFSVPLQWKDLDIYCAHTNLDKAHGGTTDRLIEAIFQKTETPECKKPEDLRRTNPDLFTCRHCEASAEAIQPFIRYVNIQTQISDFLPMLKQISPNLRYVNNSGTKTLHKIAFCAGSGSEFIQEAAKNGADALVTGDVKFHTAVESPIVLFDIGHFESEILVLGVFEKLIGSGVKVLRAEENSPFIY